MRLLKYPYIGSALNFQCMTDYWVVVPWWTVAVNIILRCVTFVYAMQHYDAKMCHILLGCICLAL